MAESTLTLEWYCEKGKAFLDIYAGPMLFESVYLTLNEGIFLNWALVVIGLQLQMMQALKNRVVWATRDLGTIERVLETLAETNL